MKSSRRGFLGIAGGALLGGVPVAGALAAGELNAERDAKALIGKKWAMVIDVRKCMAQGDCNACQDACHVAHNVPKIEGHEEEIKWIWKEPYSKAFPDQCHDYTEPKLKNGRLTVLCNHCESPACVRVCPTQATYKRADGIVIMDMHRCVGCRYCIVACPYGSRSFNFSDPRPHIAQIQKDYPTRMKGVVEKCNFCAERLAVGEMPLCVEACQKVNCGALHFGDLADPKSNVAELLRKNNAIRRKPGLGTAPQVFYIV
jgi:molybdopterin-containing oxidoreductase family iron-sulfur binding subunit